MLTIMVNSNEERMIEEVAVADAKARLSELLRRVGRGERFVVARRGTPLAALVPLDQVAQPSDEPSGLAAIAGALADWDDLTKVVDELICARRAARDREVPDLA